jgi:hypothetical protein
MEAPVFQYKFTLFVSSFVFSGAENRESAFNCAQAIAKLERKSSVVRKYFFMLFSAGKDFRCLAHQMEISGVKKSL